MRDLTLRDLELYAEGRAEAQDHVTEMVAWALSLVLSAWSSKKRVRMEDLLTHEHKARRRKRGDGNPKAQAMPVTSLAALDARIQAATMAKANARWWDSPSGHMVRRHLALYGDGPDAEREDGDD